MALLKNAKEIMDELDGLKDGKISTMFFNLVKIEVLVVRPIVPI